MTILARGEGLAGFRSLPSVSWEARVALFCSVISVPLAEMVAAPSSMEPVTTLRA